MNKVLKTAMEETKDKELKYCAHCEDPFYTSDPDKKICDECE